MASAGWARPALLILLLRLAAAPLALAARACEPEARRSRSLLKEYVPSSSSAAEGNIAVAQYFMMRLSGPSFVPYSLATQEVVLQAVREQLAAGRGPGTILTFREGLPDPNALDNSTEKHPFVDIMAMVFALLNGKSVSQWQPSLQAMLTLQTRILGLGNWSHSTHSLRLLAFAPVPVSVVPQVELQALVVIEAAVAVNLTDAPDTLPWSQQATAVWKAADRVMADVSTHTEVTISNASQIQGKLTPEAAMRVGGRQMVLLELTLRSCSNDSTAGSRCEKDQVQQRLLGLQQQSAAAPILAAAGISGVELLDLWERPTPTGPIRGEAASQEEPWVPWHLDRLDQRSQPLDGKFTATATGSGVNVYLISSGIQVDHAEFKYMDGREGTRVKAAWGYAGLNSLEDCKDSFAWFGFGTFLASIIGGLNVGVAKNVTFHSVRYRDSCLVEDPGSYTLEGLPAAINYVAANHSKPALLVIDSWWRRDRFDFDDDDVMEAALLGALDRCQEAGVTVVTTAGSFACANVLAAHNATISVNTASTYDTDMWASNTPCIDIYAPVAGLGLGMTGASPTGPADYKSIISNGLGLAPAAGVVAQYLGLNPTATPDQVRAWLLGIATPNLVMGVGPNNTASFLYTNLTAPPGTLDVQQAVPLQSPSLGVSTPGQSAAAGTGGGSSVPLAAVVVPIVAAALLGAAAFVFVRRRRRRLQSGADLSAKGLLALHLPDIKPLPGSEWEIPDEEIEICRHPDGTLWLLGEGSFGQVFKAIKGGVQVVAVKQLHPRCMDGPRREQFVQEIAIMKYVSRDANITQFYGACMTPNTMQLVVEFMEGGDLRAALTADRSGELGWYRGGKGIALDILRGLHFLHTSHVIHRDIKSKNILLTREHRAKIADVGLAQVLEEAEGQGPEQEGFGGTFAWAAPEVVLGEGCCEKADIYSVGVVLWEIVTQEVPIRGCLYDPAVPEQCPQGVVDAIHACLQRDPGARPSARELYSKLLRCPPTDGPYESSVGGTLRITAAHLAGAPAVGDPSPAGSSQPLTAGGVEGGNSSCTASSTRDDQHGPDAGREALSIDAHSRAALLGAYLFDTRGRDTGGAGHGSAPAPQAAAAWGAQESTADERSGSSHGSLFGQLSGARAAACPAPAVPARVNTALLAAMAQACAPPGRQVGEGPKPGSDGDVSGA